MPTARKVQLVEDLKTQLENAQGVVLADFTGLDVKKMTQLRRECRKAESSFFVIKNTLALHAIKEVGMEGLGQFLEGPTGWAITGGDAVTPAQILNDFSKEHKLHHIKGGFFDGVVASAEEVAAIAILPSKPVLIAQIMGLIQSPMQGLAGGLNEVVASLARALDEVRKQKEAGGGPVPSDDDTPAEADSAAEAN